MVRNRMLIIIAIIYDRSLRQIDFVMAYSQAPIETDLYMEIPYGIETTQGRSKDHLLQLLSNLYGQKQAGRVWNQYLIDKLQQVGFKSSDIDECVFYKEKVIFIVYVYDGLLLGDSDEQLTRVIKELQVVDLDIEDQGHPADYTGVNIKKHADGSYEFGQKALIDAIIDDVKLGNKAFSKPVPSK